MLRGILLVELFRLERNLSSFSTYYIHYVKTALELGTSLCFVQKNVENNQNYCEIDVLKPNIGVRDKGNKSYY